jgi:hypothetical protein
VLSTPVPELSHPDRHAIRRARFDEVTALDHRNWPIKRIARTLGLNLKTVRRWLRSGRLPTWDQRSRGSAVDLRSAPREVQEIAFEKGMIPYIPDDRG